MILTIWRILHALPSLIRLAVLLEKQIKEAGTQRKVAQDVGTIHEAFSAKDPSKLDAVFNSD